MDHFGSLPLELILYIWKILDVLLRDGWYLRFDLEAKCYGNVMVLSREWFHYFALYVYRNEIQLATVLSNNLNDKSETNIKRIEELYSRYVTTLNVPYHKNYVTFWKCLHAFNYKIAFPNLKILGMRIDERLPISPRMPVTHDLNRLVFHKRMKWAINYQYLKKFCSQIKRLEINIDTIDLLDVMYDDKYLDSCQPALCSKVRSIKCRVNVDAKKLDFLATNDSCTSLSTRQIIPVGMSPAAEALLQRLTFLSVELYHLEQFYGMNSGKRITLPNLHHLETVSKPQYIPHGAGLLPVVCPNIRNLDILLTYIYKEEDGELVAQAFNDYNAHFSANLHSLKIGGQQGLSVVERCIRKLDWSKYLNVSRLTLCYKEATKNKDRLNALIKLHAPNIQDVVFTSEWT